MIWFTHQSLISTQVIFLTTTTLYSLFSLSFSSPQQTINIKTFSSKSWLFPVWATHRLCETRLYCHGNFNVIWCSSSERHRGKIIPELNRICFRASRDEQAGPSPLSPALTLPCWGTMGSHPVSPQGWDTLLAGVSFANESPRWWKCWERSPTMSGTHRELQFVNQLVC